MAADSADASASDADAPTEDGAPADGDAVERGTEPMPIVGIGASAGGVDALCRFFLAPPE